MAAGSTDLLIEKTINKGNVIRVVFEPSTPLPEHIVNLTIKNGSRSELDEGTALQNWMERQGGDYLSAKKPFYIENKETVFLDFSSEEVLANKLSGQIIFVVEANC